MSRFAFLIALVLMCCMVSHSSNTFGQQSQTVTTARDPRVGRQIIITKAGAELKTPAATVWKGYIGEVFTVTLTNGEWLWIGEKGGWLWEKETVPFESSINIFTQRVAQQRNAENFHLRGVAYLAHKQYDKAAADFTESLRKEPRNAGALNNRGQVSFLNGDYRTAIEDFSSAIAIDAKNPLVLNNRALAYIELHDHDNALNDLKSALALVPEYPEALNHRGVVHLKLHQLDEAIVNFTAALKIYPGFNDALENRAAAFVEKKEYGLAIADLESSMQYDPHSFKAANDLAWLLSTSSEDSVRNKDRALELAKKACAITQYKEWNTLDTLAAAHAENGQFPEAQQWLGTALKMAPDVEKERLQGHLDLVMTGKPVRN